MGPLHRDSRPSARLIPIGTCCSQSHLNIRLPLLYFISLLGTIFHAQYVTMGCCVIKIRLIFKEISVSGVPGAPSFARLLCQSRCPGFRLMSSWHRYSAASPLRLCLHIQVIGQMRSYYRRDRRTVSKCSRRFVLGLRRECGCRLGMLTLATLCLAQHPGRPNLFFEGQRAGLVGRGGRG